MNYIMQFIKNFPAKKAEEKKKLKKKSTIAVQFSERSKVILDLDDYYFFKREGR